MTQTTPSSGEARAEVRRQQVADERVASRERPSPGGRSGSVLTDQDPSFSSTSGTRWRASASRGRRRRDQRPDPAANSSPPIRRTPGTAARFAARFAAHQTPPLHRGTRSPTPTSALPPAGAATGKAAAAPTAGSGDRLGFALCVAALRRRPSPLFAAPASTDIFGDAASRTTARTRCGIFGEDDTSAPKGKKMYDDRRSPAAPTRAAVLSHHLSPGNPAPAHQPGKPYRAPQRAELCELHRRAGKIAAVKLT